MKTIISLLLVLVAIYTNAQSQILPLNRRSERVSGTYYKDLDNRYTDYIGTWSGQVNGQIFKITFEKVKDYVKAHNFWEDILFAHYELKDAQGNVLYSNYNIDVSESRFFGAVPIKSKGTIRFDFIQKCYNAAIDLKFVDQSRKQINWEYIPKSNIILSTEQCPSFSQIPEDDFILTKQ